MQVLIRVPTDTRWRTPRGRNGKRYLLEPFRLTTQFETRAYRVALPKLQSTDRPFVVVDAWIPEDRRSGIPIWDDAWVKDKPGVYRTRAYIDENKKTLAPFLESGLNEMEVGE